MSMTMESGPSADTSSEKPKVIDRVPSQAELEELYTTQPDDHNSFGAHLDPDSWAALNDMRNAESDVDEAYTIEAEPATNEPELPRSRLARFLDTISQGAATAANRHQEWVAAAPERAEARQEQIDAAKVAMRRFGRSALTLPRRTIIEAKAQTTLAKEVAVEKWDAVVNTYDSIKAFFAEKKAAAEARKQARQEARNQRREARAHTKAVNAEVNERLENNRTKELRYARAARLAQKAASAALNTERAA